MRALVVAVVALAAGIVSHVAAGGRLPHPLVLALLLAGAAVVAAKFLLRPASRWRLVALVTSGQALLHLALSATAGHRGDRAAAQPTGDPFLALGARRSGTLADQWDAGRVALETGGPVAGGHPSHGGHLLSHVADQGLAMVAAHTAAAVVLGLWLAVGERALWRLVWLAAARAVVRVVLVAGAAARLAAQVGAGASLLTGLPTDTEPRPRDRMTLRPVSRRGPPGLLAPA